MSVILHLQTRGAAASGLVCSKRVDPTIFLGTYNEHLHHGRLQYNRRLQLTKSGPNRSTRMILVCF
jgi:hypothetical protein